MRLADALSAARLHGVDRLDAQLLAAHVLGKTRAWVIAHDDAKLDAPAAATLGLMIQRRADGEPLAYLVGQREFRGLALRMTPDVLVPRPDTETLIDWALELVARESSPAVVDLGTGSGAIALAVKHERPRARVHGVDASRAALTVARNNGQRLGLDVLWHEGSWWAALPPGRFDLALANPPYVAPGDPHLADLRHEPATALVPTDDPGDGLADIRRIVDGAHERLISGACLLLEHGHDQAGAVAAVLARAGFERVATRADLAGVPRVTGGVWPGG